MRIKYLQNQTININLYITIYIYIYIYIIIIYKLIKQLIIINKMSKNIFKLNSYLLLIQIISYSSSFKITNNIDFNGNIKYSSSSNPSQWNDFGNIFVNNKQMLSIKSTLNKEDTKVIRNECKGNGEIIIKIQFSLSSIDYISSIDACNYIDSNYNSIFQFSFLDDSINPNNLSAVSIFPDQSYSIGYSDKDMTEENKTMFKCKAELLNTSKFQSINFSHGFSNEKDSSFNDKTTQKQGSNSANEEEPSFFKKYWWVILVVIIMINAKMPNDEQSQQNQETSNGNASGQRKKRD